MMSQPQHIFDLHSSSLQVNTTCLTLREGETDGFLIGTENGMVHQLNLHSNQQKGEKVERSFEKHGAMVTAVSVNNCKYENPKAT
jgi:hypothetical protein